MRQEAGLSLRDSDNQARAGLLGRKGGCIGGEPVISLGDKQGEVASIFQSQLSDPQISV